MEEVAELEEFVALAKTEGNKRDLLQLINRKKAALEPKLDNQDVAPAKGDTTVGQSGSDQRFIEISRFGWEDEGYGKPKVTVHIMSGVDGVGDLPKESIQCDFTSTSFDLKIYGLQGKNYRLVKNNLDKEIDPNKSSYRVRKNRISVLLYKEDANTSWMNLTAKNSGGKKPQPNDPTAGLLDMMKNMYQEGDADTKRTIAQAWEESQKKNPAGL